MDPLYFDTCIIRWTNDESTNTLITRKFWTSVAARARVDQREAHEDGGSRQNGAARGTGMARNNADRDWLSITRCGIFVLLLASRRSLPCCRLFLQRKLSSESFSCVVWARVCLSAMQYWCLGLTPIAIIPFGRARVVVLPAIYVSRRSCTFLFLFVPLDFPSLGH